MPTRTLRPLEPDQLLLLPPSLRNWLPADQLAYFVADLVEDLDLTPILTAYGNLTRGTVPYDPRMLVAVLLYAYAVGVPASRQIARKLHQDIAFRVLAADPAGPELLMATNKDWKQRKALREQPPPRGRAPKGLTARDRMERTLLTTRGRRLYKKRGQTVEPVFGQIKSAWDCGRFMRRGTAACDSEWKLLCATHNLLKLWRHGNAGWIRRRTGRDPQRCGRGSGKKNRG
jgi:transposase